MTKKAPPPDVEVLGYDFAAPEAQLPHPLPATGGCYTLVDGVLVRDPDPETPKEA